MDISRLNATFKYIQPDSTTTNDRVFAELFNHTAALSFNSQSRFGFYDGQVGMTNSYERNDICVMIPSGGDNPVNILRTVSPTTLAITMLCVLLVPFAYRGLQYADNRLSQSTDSNDQHSQMEICTMFYQSFFGETIVRMPQSTVLRVLVAAWCLFGFLMATAFAAKLISSLVEPNPQPNIDSIAELLRQGWSFVTTEDTISGIETEQRRIDTELAKCRSPITEYDRGWCSRHVMLQEHEILSRLFADTLRNTQQRLKTFPQLIQVVDGKNNTKTAFVLNRLLADHLVAKHFDMTKQRPYYHVMDECLLYLPLVYLTERDSLYLPRVNELMSRLQQTGFIDHWREDSLLNAALDKHSDNSLLEDDIADRKVIITMEHLMPAFMVWACGVTLSLIAFFVECVVVPRWSTWSAVLCARSRTTCNRSVKNE